MDCFELSRSRYIGLTRRAVLTGCSCEMVRYLVSIYKCVTYSGVVCMHGENENNICHGRIVSKNKA